MTPLERSSFGPNVWLKREDTHELGAFKWRGALPTLAGYGDVGTVVTASTGNHGAATAWAAGQLGLRAVVFVPEQASATKLAHIERLGAEIRREGADMDEAKELGQAEATRRGVPFFEDGAEPAQYEGYAAIGDEILDQLGETPAAVVVPVGNGALLGGIGRAVKARSPETLRVGVVAAAAPVMADSWEARKSCAERGVRDLRRRARRPDRDPLRRGRPERRRDGHAAGERGARSPEAFSPTQMPGSASRARRAQPSPPCRSCPSSTARSSSSSPAATSTTTCSLVSRALYEKEAAQGILSLQMDPGQLEELRTWGQQLSRDESNTDLRACGRAILLLVDEVEKLTGAPPPDEPPDEPGEPVEQPRPPPRWRPHRIRGLRRMAVALAILGALIFATFALGARLAAPSLDAEGPAGRAEIGPAVLPSLKFSVGADPSVLGRVRWKLDGKDVTGDAYFTAGRFVLDGDRFRDGDHRLQASVAGGFPGSRTTKTWRFTVDTKGPTIAFDPPGVLIPRGHPLALAGTLEPAATLTANGRPVLVDRTAASGSPGRLARLVRSRSSRPTRSATRAPSGSGSR